MLLRVQTCEQLEPPKAESCRTQGFKEEALNCIALGGLGFTLGFRV